MLDHRRIGQHRPAPDTGKAGNRHAPHTLARQTPIRPVLDHAVDPIAAVGRNPPDPFDLRQRLFPQIVRLHRHEPLFRGAEDDGTLAAPTMRVGVIQRSMAQQPSIGLQELHNLRIGLQHMLAGEFLHDIRKPPAVVDRRQNLQLLADRRLGIVIRGRGCSLPCRGPARYGHSRFPDRASRSRRAESATDRSSAAVASPVLRILLRPSSPRRLDTLRACRPSPRSPRAFPPRSALRRRPGQRHSRNRAWRQTA